MLKIAFWTLFAVNIAVFASTLSNTDEAKQADVSQITSPFEPDRIRLLPPPAPAVSAGSGVRGETGVRPSEGCVETGKFDGQTAALFEQSIRSFIPSGQSNRLTSQTASSYMVYLPPSKDQKTAEKRIAELKAKGITQFFLIPDGTKFKRAISLGIFKTPAKAQTLVAELEKQGIHDAEIIGRGKTTESFVFRFTQLNRRQLDQLETLTSEFPQARTQACRQENAISG